MGAAIDLKEAPAEGNSISPHPNVLSCYGNGWRQMRKYFLELLLIMIFSFLLSIPTLGLYIDELNKVVSKVVSINLVFFEFRGLGAYIFLAILYLIFIEWPIEYGVAYASLRAARNDKVEVKNIFGAFGNYKNTILSYLLVTVIIVIGFILLIIPGIFFICKLVFVPYLVVDKKMDAVSAVKESWRMTKGHAFTIFLIGVAALFLSLLGLILVGVGLIFAIMWVELALAWLYHTLSSSPLNVSLNE